ncbi:MAG: hypothetical protein L0211_02805 [Planctomycetaceae bacterium]|nr:hypothetical protein [Planctomycetaceae bacterium]
MSVVTGTITLDGQVVEGGVIRFVPSNGESQPADSPIVKGTYSLTVSPGEKKVEIFWAKSKSGAPIDTASQGTDELVQMIPAEFNTQTTLLHTVADAQEVKDFALKTK